MIFTIVICQVVCYNGSLCGGRAICTDGETNGPLRYQKEKMREEREKK